MSIVAKVLIIRHRHMKKEHDADANFQAVFRIHDENGDGFLDRGELLAIYSEHEAKRDGDVDSVDDLLRQGDADKDGRLSFKEFLSVLALDSGEDESSGSGPEPVAKTSSEQLSKPEDDELLVKSTFDRNPRIPSKFYFNRTDF